MTYVTPHDTNPDGTKKPVVRLDRVWFEKHDHTYTVSLAAPRVPSREEVFAAIGREAVSVEDFVDALNVPASCIRKLVDAKIITCKRRRGAPAIIVYKEEK